MRLFEVKVVYTDHSSESLRITATDKEAAKREAQKWTNHRKIATTIIVVGEIERKKVYGKK